MTHYINSVGCNLVNWMSLLVINDDESITVESVNDQPVNEHITDESVFETVNNPYCGVYNFFRMLHYYFSFMLDQNTYFQILVKGYFNSTIQLFLIAQIQQ